MRRFRATAAVLARALACVILAPSFQAHAATEVEGAFVAWARKSLHPVSTADLDSSTRDLAPVEKMIGDAKIVGLSEGIHAAAEPLSFRNRLFKHLVEHKGFTAIGLESGIVEGRVLNDYVTEGKGQLDTVLKEGLSTGSDTFRQNGELIRWMRNYNEHLPRGASKVQIFGLDVPGSPGNPDAGRRPDTALRTSLDYLRVVDPDAATDMQARVETFFPLLRDTAGYGTLSQSERDTLTASIEDLVSLMQRQQLAYVAKSSKDEYEWAERTAIGARQTDTWFRRMPLGWKLGDGFEWTQYSQQVRDRVMADNLDWVLHRLGPGARVLVYAAIGHLASTPVYNLDHRVHELIGTGTYLRTRYGTDFVDILNLVFNGEIKYCSARPRTLMPLKPAPETAVENLFAALNVPQFVLDLRHAPARVSAWLHDNHDHWNGFGRQQFATADAFDVVYYVSPVTSACVAE